MDRIILVKDMAKDKEIVMILEGGEELPQPHPAEEEETSTSQDKE